MGEEFEQGHEIGGFVLEHSDAVVVLDAVVLVGDEDLEGGGVAELLVELAAVAAGGGGDGDGEEAGAAVDGEVGEEELLGVDGVVEGDAGEFEIDADEDAAVGAEADGADVEVGDGGAGEGLGGVDEVGEEVEDGGEVERSGDGFRH